MMLGFYGEAKGVEIREIRLGEHLISGVLLKQRFGKLKPQEVPEAMRLFWKHGSENPS